MTSDAMMSPPTMNDGSNDGSAVMKRSTWPTVLGVIGIIFGSLGILSSTCGFFLPTILQSMVEQMGPEEQAKIMESMPAGAFLYVSLTVGLVLSLVMLWGSVNLLKRRQSARGLLNAYAVASILWFLCGFIWQATVIHPEMKAKQAELGQASQEQAVAEPGDSSDQSDSPVFSAQDPAMADAQFYFSQACGGVMKIGWCVLVLVFMNAGRYRDEMETWAD